METPNVSVVYSAKHTGTWFAVNLLATNSGKTLGRSDAWLSEITNKPLSTWEDISLPLSKEGILSFIKKQKRGNDLLEKNKLSQLTIQAHHKNKNAIWWHRLQGGLGTIPVLVPIRNPLLALNTTIWRQTRSIEKFLKESIETRQARLENVFSCIGRVLSLPGKFMVPIDRPDMIDENNRVKLCKDAMIFVGLKPTEQTVEFAKQWKPVNISKEGKFPEHDNKMRDEDNAKFIMLKEQIAQEDIQEVKKFYDVEFSIIKKLTMKYSLNGLFARAGYPNKAFSWM